MAPINLNLLSTIKRLRNIEFMHLYLQLLELTEQYVVTTNNEYIQRVYENMQKQVEHVKQLDVKLNAASQTVKTKNEVQQDIKNSIRYIKGRLESNLLSPSNDYRAKAAYIYERLEGLINHKSVRSIATTITTIPKIRHTIENDIILANALLELDLTRKIHDKAMNNGCKVLSLK